MSINNNKPQNWKADIALSVDMYNEWFMKFAPKAFRDTRIDTTKAVEATLRTTDNMRNFKPEILRQHPEVLATLRMSTCPPLAVDRLIGLAGVSPNLVKTMENDKALPPRMALELADQELTKIGVIIEKMADPDIFVWLGHKDVPAEAEVHRAAPSLLTVYAEPWPIPSSGMHKRRGSSPPSKPGSNFTDTNKQHRRRASTLCNRGRSASA